VLQMKSMNIDNVVNFPFPTPPNRESIRVAESLLVNLGALDKEKKHITDLGRMMAAFPVAPRYAKMLIIGQQKGCLPYVVTLVAALTVGDPFIRDVFEEESEQDHDTKEEKELRRKRRAEAHKAHLRFTGSSNTGDCVKLLKVIFLLINQTNQTTKLIFFFFCKRLLVLMNILGEVMNFVKKTFYGLRR